MISVGDTLGATPGLWTNSPTGFTYQWNRHETQEGAATPIPDATNETYTVVAADDGKWLSRTQTPINGAGTGPAETWAPVYVGDPAAAFDPLTLTGIERWWDPTDDATITLVSGVVSQITSKAAAGTLTQSVNASYRPAIGAINGVQAFDFDGSNDRLTVGSAGTPTFFATTDAPFTVIGVYQPDTAVSALPFTVYGSSEYFALPRTDASSQWGVQKRDDGGTVVSQFSTTVADATPVIIVITSTGTTVTMRINGVEVITDQPFDVGAITPNSMAWGCYGNSSGFYNGKAGDKIICNGVISGTEIANIEAYLAVKWGITL